MQLGTRATKSDAEADVTALLINPLDDNDDKRVCRFFVHNRKRQWAGITVAPQTLTYYDEVLTACHEIHQHSLQTTKRDSEGTLLGESTVPITLRIEKF